MKSSARSRRHRNAHTHDEQPGQTPVFSKSHDVPVQTKLSIGQPGDAYEKEADAVANAVVNRSGNVPAVQQKTDGVQRSTLTSSAEDEKLATAEGRMEKDKMIQRSAEAPAKEPEEKLQTMPEKEEEIKKKPEEEEQIGMKAESGSRGGHASPALAARLHGSKGGGRPLSGKTLQHMETAIGADFQSVNIHTDPDAVEMNKSLRAQAFTHGKDIYFNDGKFNPETTEGKRLLVHELTHVVQQGGPEVQPQMDKVGEKFAHTPGAQSPYKKISGHFDGRTFKLLGDGGEIMDASAQSGRPYSVAEKDAKKCGGSTDDSYMNNPMYVGIRDNGPIPEGTYQFFASQMATFGFFDRIKLNLGKNKTFTDPFGNPMHGGDWGAGRVALTPVSIKPGPKGCGNTGSRSGFYLHGGILPGSSGCIDVGNGGYKKVLKHLDGYNGKITITVKYEHGAEKVGWFKRMLGRLTYGDPENQNH